MKPDVLKQIAQIEKDRDKMVQEEMAKNGQIMLNQPGKPPVPMSMTQVADLLSNQGQQLQAYERRIAELENINRNLQKLLLEKSVPKEDDLQKPSTLQEMNTLYGPALPPTQTKTPDPVSKSQPLFKLDASMI